eukprot:3186040-Rhodomonas_salina.3
MPADTLVLMLFGCVPSLERLCRLPEALSELKKRDRARTLAAIAKERSVTVTRYLHTGYPGTVARYH